MEKQGDSASLTRRGELKKQREFQKKKARMATYWRSWIEFENYLGKEPFYSRRIHKIVATISQEMAVEKNKNNVKITWDTARDRVLTLDTLQNIESTFGKSFRTVLSDVARLACHSSWLAGIARRGQFGIWSDVVREHRELMGIRPPEVALVTPTKPVQMTAAQINREVTQRNSDFQKAQKEFLGDPERRSRTRSFDFVAEIDRQMWRTGMNRSAKRPRKNWRKEIG